MNTHSDKNFEEFAIHDAARPEFLEIAYTPGEHKPDHGRHYKIWVPLGDFFQVIPDE